MKVRDCQAVRSRIEEAELDQYPGAEAAEHLRACAECRDFERERRALRQLVGALGTVRAPADFDFRLKARLAASNVLPRRRSLFGFLPAPGVPAIALAATFAVLVATAVTFKQAKVFHGSTVAPEQQAVSAPASAGASAAESVESKGGQRVTQKNGERWQAGSTSLAAARRRTRTEPKSVEERGAGPASAASSSTLAVAPKGGSLDFSGSPATVVSLFSVQVPEANQPMKVSLEDRRGHKRTVSVQRVTFGSQELIEQGSGAGRAPLSSSKGVW